MAMFTWFIGMVIFMTIIPAAIIARAIMDKKEKEEYEKEYED